MNNKKRGITMKKNSLNKFKWLITVLVVVFVFQMAFLQVDNVSHVYAKESKDIYYGDELYSEQGPNVEIKTEYISYSSQRDSCYFINSTYPMYYNTNTLLSNTCANTAGSNIIGFYDRYYDSLIPNCTVGRMSTRHFMYYKMVAIEEQVQGVINDLYVRMSTNNPEAGTTQAQYKNGLTSYVESKGLSTTYYSVMKETILDMDLVIQQLKSGYPVTLYLSGYNLSSVEDNNGVVTITKRQYEGNHIMIVFGYDIIDYLDENDLIIKSKTFLYVTPGMGNADYNTYIVNNNGKVNDAEATKIT